MGRPPKSATHRIQFGPAIPLVPIGDFVNLGYGDEFYDMAWYIVGPTIERNFEKLHTKPHILYCIAFIEGMRMAISQLTDAGENNESRKEKLRTSKEPVAQEPVRGLYELGEW
jgi:hypothetical protein